MDEKQYDMLAELLNIYRFTSQVGPGRGKSGRMDKGFQRCGERGFMVYENGDYTSDNICDWCGYIMTDSNKQSESLCNQN